MFPNLVPCMFLTRMSRNELWCRMWSRSEGQVMWWCGWWDMMWRAGWRHVDQWFWNVVDERSADKISGEAGLGKVDGMELWIWKKVLDKIGGSFVALGIWMEDDLKIRWRIFWQTSWPSSSQALSVFIIFAVVDRLSSLVFRQSGWLPKPKNRSCWSQMHLMPINLKDPAIYWISYTQFLRSTSWQIQKRGYYPVGRKAPALNTKQGYKAGRDPRGSA